MLNIDCKTWEGLTLGRKQLQRVGAFAEMDKLDQQLLATATGVFADSRRTEAVRKSCPGKLLEMEKLLQQSGIADLQATNTDAILNDLPELAESDLAKLEKAVAAERQRRQALPDGNA